MKIFFILFALLAVVLAALPFLDQSGESETLTGLPWQVETLPDGITRVFGLQIGSSRLTDVLDILGSDMDLAIIAAPDEVGNLEMYYGHYRTGLLSGKLVLQTGIGEQEIIRLRENSVNSKYMASGQAKKYILSPDDLIHVLNETVTGVTFIPVVNLDEEVILARFGEPDRRIQLTGVTHYLYPRIGLEIALHEEGKEVLQYVSPHAFQQLIKPLEKEEGRH
ncbi:MAG: hypothetical protein GQ572_07875 [Gammaproteobacteria bacterium]|nr:hypothetical protein [Gammaproteobacteria bacterium]